MKISRGHIYLLLLVLAVSLIFFFGNRLFATNHQPATPPAPNQEAKNNPPPGTPTTTPLGRAVAAALQGTSGTYGIVIKNLKTGETFSQNEHRLFDTASLYKLWVMGATVSEIESKNLDENETLTEDVAYLNNKYQLDSETAELTEGTVTMRAGEAMEQMITQSNNYDTFLLTDRVTVPAIRSYITNNGFHESDLGTDSNPPTTTAADIALFLEKLYRGQLANQPDTAWMLETLKNQQLNNKIPQFLPNNTAVAHKTGELGAFSHDAGIIYSPKGDYILVVLSESIAPYLASDRIADISQSVYDYFN